MKLSLSNKNNSKIMLKKKDSKEFHKIKTNSSNKNQIKNIKTIKIPTKITNKYMTMKMMRIKIDNKTINKINNLQINKIIKKTMINSSNSKIDDYS
jgi:hypothetical protein